MNQTHRLYNRQRETESRRIRHTAELVDCRNVFI